MMYSWAIITGGGAGIGASLAKHLAAHGYKILAIDCCLKPLLELQSYNPSKIYTLHADVADSDTPAQIESMIPSEDQISIVVQNAAVAKASIFSSISRKEFESFLSVNVTAPLMLIQQLLPRLKAGKARILHMGTGLAHRTEVGYTAYCLSKCAFYQLYKQLNAEFNDSGICVGSVKTGAVDTDSFWKGHEEATHNNLPMVALENEVIQNGMVFKPDETARLLGYILLSTSDEEFSKDEWNAYDKHHWVHWRNPVSDHNGALRKI